MNWLNHNHQGIKLVSKLERKLLKKLSSVFHAFSVNQKWFNREIEPVLLTIDHAIILMVD